MLGTFWQSVIMAETLLRMEEVRAQQKALEAEHDLRQAEAERKMRQARAMAQPTELKCGADGVYYMDEVDPLLLTRIKCH